MASVRIYPSLIACLKVALGIFGTLFLFLLGVDVARDLAAGRPVQAPPARAFIAFAVLTLAFALIVFLVSWIFACTVDRSGVRGFNLIGRRVIIPWTDVGSVDVQIAQGIPAVVVTSTSSRRRVYICTLGLNTNEIYQLVLSGVVASTA